MVRSLSDASQTFLEIANDSPYPVRLAGMLDCPRSAASRTSAAVFVWRRCRGRRPQPGLDLLPYGVAAIRIGAPQVQLCVGDALSFRGRADHHAGPLQRASAQLARLNHGLSASPAEPANPGFEPVADPKEALAGGARWSRWPRPRAPART